jgi:antibiotic biosynthesis monooxygenase (ABM) superfamily enzyme
MVEPHVVIIPFEVDEGHEEDYLAPQREAVEFMATQPGFISSRIYRAVAEDARFRFIFIGEWDSAEECQQAMASCTSRGREDVPRFRAFGSTYEPLEAFVAE